MDIAKQQVPAPVEGKSREKSSPKRERKFRRVSIEVVVVAKINPFGFEMETKSAIKSNKKSFNEFEALLRDGLGEQASVTANYFKQIF